MKKIIYKNRTKHGRSYDWAKVIQQDDGSLRYRYGYGNDFSFEFTTRYEIGELYIALFKGFFDVNNVESRALYNRPWMADFIVNQEVKGQS